MLREKGERLGWSRRLRQGAACRWDRAGEPGRSQCGSFADGAGGPRSRLTTGKRRLKSPFPAKRQTAEVCYVVSRAVYNQIFSCGTMGSAKIVLRARVYILPPSQPPVNTLGRGTLRTGVAWDGKKVHRGGQALLSPCPAVWDWGWG